MVYLAKGITPEPIIPWTAIPPELATFPATK